MTKELYKKKMYINLTLHKSADGILSKGVMYSTTPGL